MNTAKIYYDSNDNECSIHQMVEREPYWAASRIQEGEKAIEELAALRRENEDLRARVERYEKDECFTPPVTCSDNCSLLKDARDKHYMDCEKIAEAEASKMEAEMNIYPDGDPKVEVYEMGMLAAESISKAIARAREGK